MRHAVLVRLVVAFALMVLPMPLRAQGMASAGEEVLFDQPALGDVAGHFHVPTAEHRYPTEHPFNLLFWERNPLTPNGDLVPTDWPAWERTGFRPSEPLMRHQLAIRNAPDASTVQAEGRTVGVYLNSRDLTEVSEGHQMMITPAFREPRDAMVFPFARAGTMLVTTFDLQVPTAVDTYRPGSATYVVSDLQLEDRASHTRISYGTALFHHRPSPVRLPGAARLHEAEVGVFDKGSKSYQIGNPLAPDSRLVRILPGSDVFQTQPWRGWRHFAMAISPENFQIGLIALHAQRPDFKGSTNPADYILVGWHLNAELQYATGPAELGWSMRDARITLVSVH